MMQDFACTYDHGLASFDTFAAQPFAARGTARWRNGTKNRSYRKVLALVDLLAARFPVVRRLAGEQSFLGAARGFAFTQPPHSASLLRYGEAFPRFMRSLGDATSIEYLADIAALEWARHKARFTARAIAAYRLQLSRQSIAQLCPLRVVLHPSVSLIPSRFPIVTIWEANRSNEQPVIRYWKPEPALVARPSRIVEIRRLPSGGYEFINALQAGTTIGTAVEAGCAAARDFDIASNLAVLAESKIPVAVG
jgi:hypothetical protein